MGKMKKEFDLDEIGGGEYTPGTISIGLKSENQKKPFVSIHINGLERSVYLKDKDLETFAVNILKALKSKKLK